eukprot:snap_masked-scaffold_57-processed-gene-1.35-mRNA-1 protein AED:1.00 eAED:1.00 QI:0/-1/0/0/-1/1/1/0/105
MKNQKFSSKKIKINKKGELKHIPQNENDNLGSTSFTNDESNFNLLNDIELMNEEIFESKNCFYLYENNKYTYYRSSSLWPDNEEILDLDKPIFSHEIFYPQNEKK